MAGTTMLDFQFLQWFAGRPRWQKYLVSAILLVLGFGFGIEDYSGIILVSLGGTLLLVGEFVKEDD